ncbi:MAG: serine hydrolase [Candidatus Nanopelagicaceae bacterium]|nr:serine hydrolase [Candidatus Nanopelagicaceae bacterium]
MRTLFRFVRNLLIGLLAFYILLFSATRIIHYPEPIAAIRLGLAPASKTPTLMPFHIVDPATKPVLWSSTKGSVPESVNWDGTSISFKDFLARTSTTAFLVVRDGVITYEWYGKSENALSKLPSYSMAKTLTSIMIGQLVAEGKIKESDTFVQYFPEFKTGGSFDKITIQSLLDMESGVGVSDNYPTGPSGWGVAIAQMYATTDLNFFMEHNRKMSWDPGTNAEYRSVDTQMLGFIIKKVTGMSVSDYFSKNVWQPISAEQSAFWNVDHVGGLEKTFCCFNATARDWARIGALILNNGAGKIGNANLINAAWMNRLTTPVVTLDHGWGYGAQIWHPFAGASMLLGLHGQFIFIQPSTHMVIVKLSDQPTDSGDDEVLTAGVLHDIATTGS